MHAGATGSVPRYRKVRHYTYSYLKRITLLFCSLVLNRATQRHHELHEDLTYLHAYINYSCQI